MLSPKCRKPSQPYASLSSGKGAARAGWWDSKGNAHLTPLDTWFKGDRSLAIRCWGTAPVTDADLAAVADCLGFKVPPSKTLIRVRGYGIMFGTNENIVKNEMARVFSSGAPALQLVGFSHVQSSGRRSPIYVVEVTGLPESWPGAP